MCRLLLIFVFEIFTICKTSEILAIRKKTNEFQYETENTLQNSYTESVISCLTKCSQHACCLSLFYNNVTRQCLLHEDSFIYTKPSETGPWWRHYQISDYRHYTPGFIYHPGLDLFYNLNGPFATNFTFFKETCNADDAQLLRIDSIQRQRYVELIMNTLPATIYFCIQGTNQIDSLGKWTFDDGTLMPYLNWYTWSSQPIAGQGNIAMNSGREFKWFSRDTEMTDECMFVCEKLN